MNVDKNNRGRLFTGPPLERKMSSNRKKKRGKLRWKCKKANHGKAPGMKGKK